MSMGQTAEVRLAGERRRRTGVHMLQPYNGAFTHPVSRFVSQLVPKSRFSLSRTVCLYSRHLSRDLLVTSSMGRSLRMQNYRVRRASLRPHRLLGFFGAIFCAVPDSLACRGGWPYIRPAVCTRLCLPGATRVHTFISRVC